MWRAEATQDNVRCLRERGVRFIGPATGDQACGETGPGRMVEPETIAGGVFGAFHGRKLAGRRVLIDAGPTQEPIDAVRYVSNRSSGKMGYAIARAAADAGANVTLVSGPVALDAPHGVTLIRVVTAAEMHTAVIKAIADQDIFIAAAAVADYTVSAPAAGKRKKQAVELALTLIPTTDILAAVAGRKNAPFTVGFAAETDDLIENARNKLQQKSLDMIAANWVDKPRQGFNAEQNELHVFWRGGDHLLPLADKDTLARDLVDLIADRYLADTPAGAM
jgi:phosphopantothenoylcysteine decarboxylase/phosphopantothenate--cysteine ligase